MSNKAEKTRKVGNSNVFALTNCIVGDAEEYSVYRGRDGTIVYVPESVNPFSDPNWDKKFNVDNDDDQ